jgi:hypothetical protein
MGMLNSVGLQGHGIEHWLAHELPPLIARGATVVASIWGRTVDDFAAAAEMLAAARGMADWSRHELRVRTLQEYHRGVNADQLSLPL